jgi:hypothetical protein
MTTATTREDDLYYGDWYRWAREQAGGLRLLADERINTDLELARIAEDLDEMADSRLDALTSQIRRIVEHLLKLEFSPAVRPRRMWRLSVREARVRAGKLLTKTLENEARAALADTYADARELAVEAMREFEELAAADTVPSACPYAFEQILDRDWFPAPRAEGVGG